MKKILILLFILPFFAKAQVPTLSLDTTYAAKANKTGVLVVTDAIYIPKQASTDTTLFAQFDQYGKLIFRKVTSSGTAGTAFDSTSLSNRINLKVNISDTANMLLNYRNAINSKVNYTDTAAMLTAYKTAINLKVNISDTSAMLAAYRAGINTNATAITTKLNITDTANIRLRATAGTNTTITGTYPNLTFNSIGSNGWNLIGNAGTDSATNFIGTTDAKPFRIKVNGNNAIKVDTTGRVAIGSTTNTFGYSLGSPDFITGPLRATGNSFFDASLTVGNGIVVTNLSALTGNVSVGFNGAIGGAIPLQATSAQLELRSTTQGVLFPRMTTTQRNAIASPATGLQVYNNTDSVGNYFNGVVWKPTASPAAGSNGQIQYNTGGSFAANSNLSFNGSNTLNLAGLSFINNGATGLGLSMSNNGQGGVMFDGIYTINNSGRGLKIGPVGTHADPSSQLELLSTTRGFLTSRMTTAQRDAITAPATGLQIYNTTTNQFNYFDGNVWNGVQGGIVGDVYNKTSFTGIPEFTVVGATAAIVGGNIRLSGGTNDYGKYLTMDSLINCDTNVSMEIKYTLVTAGTGNGIGIGRLSTNTTFSNSVMGAFGNYPTFGGAYINKGNSTIISSFKDTLFENLPIGTNLRIVFTERDNVMTCLIHNVTTGYQKTIIYEDALNNTGDLPTTSKWAIWVIGTQTVDVTSIRINSQSQVGAPICLIGDSKMVGYGTGDVSKTVKNLLGLQMYAAGGDKTAELLSALPYMIKYLKPKTVIVGIGSNDIRTSISATVWQANYNSIISLLSANNITAYHFLSLPETTLNQTALYNFIKSVTTVDKQIDLYGFLKQPAMLASDGIHPNVLGNRNIVNILRSQGIVNN